MTKTVSVRLDEEALRALATLENRGASRSAAVRDALLRSAAEARAPDTLRDEATRLAADADDRAEIAAVNALLDEVSDAW